MIEVKYIYILIYVFYTLATVTTTFETSDRKRLIGDGDGDAVGERLAATDRWTTSPEIDNKFQVRAKQGFTINDEASARSVGGRGRGGREEGEEGGHEANKQQQIRLHSHNGGSLKARYNPDRSRRLSVGELPVNAPAHTESDIDQLANNNLAPDSTINLACDRFSAFWSRFKAVYPSLAAHLVSLGNLNAFKFGLESPKLNWKQLAKQNIARHLEEAERLAEQSSNFNNVSSSYDHQIFDSNQLREENSSSSSSSHLRSNISPADNFSSKQSWLSRVQPIYAKLYQFLQRNRQQQQQQRHQIGSNKQRVDPASNPTQTDKQQEQADLHVYGRVVHYPHELASNGSPLQTTSQTLDKLRQLNQQNRQQQHISQNLPITNEIDPLAAGGRMSELSGGGGASKQDQDVESNNIQILGDGQAWQDRQHHHHHHSPGDGEDSDSIRNKYVYGSVILRPNQRNAADQHHPLESLRNLNQDLDQGRASDDATLSNSDANRSGRIQQQQQQQQQQDKSGKSGLTQSSESYGRILVNPPSLSADNSYLTDADLVSGGGGGGSNEARWSIGRPQLTLEKLRHQLELPAASENLQKQAQQPTDDSADHYAGDELGKQQHGTSVANSAANHALAGPTSETGNEFEGTWHAGPLQQIEVRQTRADEHNSNTRRSNVQTPSSSGEVFLID